MTGLVIPGGQLAAQSGITHARLVERIDSLLASRVERLPFTALAVSVVHPLEVLHEAAAVAGGRSARALTPDSPVPVGDIGETFNATIIMQLVDEGRLRLDDPVSDHLQYRWADRHGDDSVPTVRQLLQHRTTPPDDAPVIVAELLDAVAGSEAGRLLATRLFHPMMMTASTAGMEGSPAATMVTSSVHDLGRYLRMTLGMGSLDEVAVMSPSSAMEMSSFDPGHPYAIGWRWRMVDSLPAMGISGSAGEYRTELIVVPSVPVALALVAEGGSRDMALRTAVDIARLAMGLDPLPGPMVLPAGTATIAVAVVAALSLLAVGRLRRRREAARV